MARIATKTPTGWVSGDSPDATALGPVASRASSPTSGKTITPLPSAGTLGAAALSSTGADATGISATRSKGERDLRDGSKGERGQVRRCLDQKYGGGRRSGSGGFRPVGRGGGREVETAPRPRLSVVAGRPPTVGPPVAAPLLDVDSSPGELASGVDSPRRGAGDDGAS